MNKAGFSEDSHESFDDLSDDIPVAVRDIPSVTPKQKLQRLILLVGGISAFLVLAVVSGFVFFATTPKRIAESQPLPASSVATPAPTVGNSAESETVLNHFAYPEALQSELAPISADGRIRMRKTAAQKFQEMVQAARSSGVILVPISGFRSVKEQEQLFFTIGAQRNQTPAQRAALSAPPGHSEHHTGYAVDIGDGAAPSTNLRATFEQTKAFAWLEANAARFGFELSFPKDNVQGVSYEPWHWRFVGDRDSLETFYKARNLKPVKTGQ
ncbi:MAG TPA: D-alanyl-D-alanine carboxypeptidase family protein [Leptolyngbyaceae cyanobacterium]